MCSTQRPVDYGPAVRNRVPFPSDLPGQLTPQPHPASSHARSSGSLVVCPVDSRSTAQGAPQAPPPWRPSLKAVSWGSCGDHSPLLPWAKYRGNLCVPCFVSFCCGCFAYFRENSIAASFGSEVQVLDFCENVFTVGFQQLLQQNC